MLDSLKHRKIQSSGNTSIMAGDTATETSPLFLGAEFNNPKESAIAENSIVNIGIMTDARRQNKKSVDQEVDQNLAKLELGKLELSVIVSPPEYPARLHLPRFCQIVRH